VPGRPRADFAEVCAKAGWLGYSGPLMAGGDLRWWLRSLAIGGAVGFAVGLVVGGTLGRVFMRLLFLARSESEGLQTAFGATIGELTAGGTFFIAVFGAGVGLLSGLLYVAFRWLLSARLAWREAVFVTWVTLLLLGIVVRQNLEDFGLLPSTLGLALTAGSIALTATPIPLLIERLAPDRVRRPGTPSRIVVGLALAVVLALAVSAVVDAYQVEDVL
jgi:hypothetical protein